MSTCKILYPTDFSEPAAAAFPLAVALARVYGATLIVLSADPPAQALVVTVDPGMPLAWKREPYYSVLKRFSEVFFRLNQKVLANLRGHITVILPDRDVSVGLVSPGDQIDIWREGQVYGATLRRGTARSPQTSQVLGSL